MSVSTNATLMLGFMFNKEQDLTITEYVRHCNHNAPKSARFCPECGKPLSEPKRKRLLYEDDDAVKPYHVKEGNMAYTGTGYSRYTDEYVVVGSVVPNGCLESFDTIDLDALKDQIAFKLIAAGVDPNKGQFGLHVVHYFG